MLFLIYINDLSDGLTTNGSLFTDDVSLFSAADNANLSATNLNSDLRKINAWAEPLQKMFEKINKAISLLRKLQNNLTRTPLATIYKSFIWPHQNYGDILYDQTFNNSFHERLELIQSNVALSRTGAIGGSLVVKLHQELGR